WTWARGEAEHRSERSVAEPELVHEALVDHRDAGREEPVGGREIASGEERNRKRLEETGPDVVDRGARIDAVAGLEALDVEPGALADAREERDRRGRRRRHAGAGAQRVLDRAVQRHRPCLVAAVPTGR